MPPLQDILIALRTTWSEWMRTRWTELEFGDARTALLVFVVLLAIALLFLLVSFMRSGSLRGKIGLPAVLPVMRRSPLSLVRHVPLMLFLAGVPFFAIALADPLTGFAREEVSYPGRRIAVTTSASTGWENTSIGTSISTAPERPVCARFSARGITSGRNFASSTRHTRLHTGR